MLYLIRIGTALLPLFLFLFFCLSHSLSVSLPTPKRPLASTAFIGLSQATQLNLSLAISHGIHPDHDQVANTLYSSKQQQQQNGHHQSDGKDTKETHICKYLALPKSKTAFLQVGVKVSHSLLGFYSYTEYTLTATSQVSFCVNRAKMLLKSSRRDKYRRLSLRLERLEFSKRSTSCSKSS